MSPRTSPVTVRDVAARAGVALSTVSKVLNRPDSVTPGVLVRVRAAIDELGYVRNEAARALRLGDSRAVGLLIRESSNPFSDQLADAAGEVLSVHDFTALLAVSAFSPKAERNLIKLFGAQQVRGLLITPVRERPAGLDGLVARGVPVVYLDARPPSSGYCSARVDDVLGARMAVEHLVSLGRRRIAVVRGRFELPQARDRITGAQAAAGPLGAEIEEVSPPPIGVAVPSTSGYSIEGGLAAGAAIADRPPELRPDAVFAVNDLLGMGIVSALMDRGISVPHDIAVVGYDGIAPAAVARVPLTTIKQPALQIGTRAAALLIEEMEAMPLHKHEDVVFAPELVVRASTVT